jgi:hypothetical protein
LKSATSNKPAQRSDAALWLGQAEKELVLTLAEAEERAAPVILRRALALYAENSPEYQTLLENEPPPRIAPTAQRAKPAARTLTRSRTEQAPDPWLEEAPVDDSSPLTDVTPHPKPVRKKRGGGSGRPRKHTDAAILKIASLSATPAQGAAKAGMSLAGFTRAVQRAQRNGGDVMLPPDAGSEADYPNPG